MAESNSGQEKTEEPTQKKLDDSSKKGQTLRSKELVTTLMVLFGSLGILFMSGSIAVTMVSIFKHNFSLTAAEAMDTSLMVLHLTESLTLALQAIMPLLILFFLLSIIGNVALGGWNLSWEALLPKWSRMDPIAGVKKIFSVKGLMEMAKAFGKFVLVVAVAMLVLNSYTSDFLSLANQPLLPAMKQGLESVAWCFVLVSSSLIVISAIDIPFQIAQHMKQLRMTKQEVKDEYKSTEGKPEVKSKVRQLQYEMSQRRMMGEVPDADVVIVNPTHFSVALKYDPMSMGAPLLVAKGADTVALKIREIAKENKVPIVEAPPLARSVYYHTKLDQEIPEGLYLAVAQVLAYIHQINQYQAGKGSYPGKAPRFEVPDELSVAKKDVDGPNIDDD